MKRYIVLGAIAAAAVAMGSYVGYRVATDSDFRNKIADSFDAFRKTSQSKVSGMSEEVAARTAQVTRNPHVNQEWIAQQWESVGY